MAVALVIGVAAFNLVLGQRLSANATALARGQAAAELSSLQVVDGSSSLADRAARATRRRKPVWVFAGSDDPREAARAGRADRRRVVARRRARGDGAGQRVRAALRAARDGTAAGGSARSSRACSLAPYDETATIALVGSIGLAIVLLAAVALLSHWILGKALLPVSRMTDDAAAWSDHDLDRRFDRGEPYDELTRLAATLDALLERLSASLRHEQRLTAELSHELRTPLAKIAAETRARAPPRPDERRLPREPRGRPPERRADDAHRRGAPLRRTRRRRGSRRVDERCAGRQYGQRSRRCATRRKRPGWRSGSRCRRSPVTVAVEADLLERIVHPLLDNAVRYGRSQVSVEVGVSGTTAFVEVVDDGAGLEADEADAIFEPGRARLRRDGRSSWRGPRARALPAARAQRRWRGRRRRRTAPAAGSASRLPLA